MEMEFRTGNLSNENENSIFDVLSFREKPDHKTALDYIVKGNFLWNAGIFIWKTNNIIEAFEHFIPEISETFNSILSNKIGFKKIHEKNRKSSEL